VEFARWLQCYGLLRNLAPQTTSLIDLYDEEHVQFLRIQRATVYSKLFTNHTKPIEIEKKKN